MSAATTTPREEEQAARREQRERERFARRMAVARERAERDEARERQRDARQALDELRPVTREARRAYFHALADATRERARDTIEDVARRFDEADRRMDVLMSLVRRQRHLEGQAR